MTDWAASTIAADGPSSVKCRLAPMLTVSLSVTVSPSLSVRVAEAVSVTRLSTMLTM
jgi:hypothetical protein